MIVKTTQYRKRPRTVEVVKWDGSPDGAQAIVEWMTARVPAALAVYREPADHPRVRFPIITFLALNGPDAVRAGDYVVFDRRDGLYTCTQYIFDMDYDEETP